MGFQMSYYLSVSIEQRLSPPCLDKSVRHEILLQSVNLADLEEDDTDVNCNLEKRKRKRDVLYKIVSIAYLALSILTMYRSIIAYLSEEWPNFIKPRDFRMIIFVEITTIDLLICHPLQFISLDGDDNVKLERANINYCFDAESRKW